MNVVAIFDIGKTNKKVFLFNENYKIVWEKSVNLEETTDEDGFPCEDIEVLKNWILYRLSEIKELKDYVLKAINFSTYGASFVYIDENGKVLTPLYNYLKDYPEDLKADFYEKYKGEKKFAVKTASPVLGSLNSGMQIYRIKEQKPEIFEKVKYCLHLPQFLSFLLTNEAYADITSIGCHTNLWNFKKMKYHKWLKEEGISDKIPPIHFGKDVIMTRENIAIGVGLHDSSSAIIPYTINFTEPFVLLSTGTWSISYKIQSWNLSMDYTGNVYSPMKLPLLSETDPRSPKSPWYSIQNIQFTYSGWKDFEVYGGIKNLLNFTPKQNNPFLISRTNDPFDKNVQYDSAGKVLVTPDNPYGLTFDTTYVYGQNQTIRGFLGLRYTFR